MKKIALAVFVLVLVAGCAQSIKYERAKPYDLPKAPAYQLPPDPFKDVPAPRQMFFKKGPDGKWVECPKAEGEIIAYLPKEHDKIVLKLQYLNQLVPQLENLINVHIALGNKSIDLVLDQQLAKEMYKEMWIDGQNQLNSNKMWFNVEKGGFIAVIIGLIIEVGLLAL